MMIARDRNVTCYDSRSQMFIGQDIHRTQQSTWLGVSRKGKFAALTNYLSKCHPIRKDTKPRGMLFNT